MSQGKVVQIIGAVVDVEFPRESVPKVYDALKVQNTSITLEVQQQLGDGVVRTIALGSTDGLKRGLVAENTGEGIKVPVGDATLGRIMDVLGTPIEPNARSRLPPETYRVLPSGESVMPLGCSMLSSTTLMAPGWLPCEGAMRYTRVSP